MNTEDRTAQSPDQDRRFEDLLCRAYEALGQRSDAAGAPQQSGRSARDAHSS